MNKSLLFVPYFWRNKKTKRRKKEMYIFLFVIKILRGEGMRRERGWNFFTSQENKGWVILSIENFLLILHHPLILIKKCLCLFYIFKSFIGNEHFFIFSPCSWNWSVCRGWNVAPVSYQYMKDFLLRFLTGTAQVERRDTDVTAARKERNGWHYAWCY